MHPEVGIQIPRTARGKPFDADVWNGHFANWVNGNRAQHAKWNDKDGGVQVHMDPDAKTVTLPGATFSASALSVTTPATFGSSVAVAGPATFGGSVAVVGPATFAGPVTLGDAPADAITIKGTLTAIAPATFQGNVTLGDAASDVLTVNATSGFKSAAAFDGNVALGNAAGDAITIAGTTTASAPITLTAGVLTVPAGAVGAPSLAIGEATTGFWRPLAGQLALSLAGVEEGRWTATGLGIGTTAPVRALHVVKAGGVPQVISTGSNVDDAVVVDGDPTAAVNLVCPPLGNGLVKFSTPLTHQRAVIWWDDTNAELKTIVGALNIGINASRINLAGPVRVGSTGGTLGFYGVAGVTRPSVTGSRGGNAALTFLLGALANQNLIVDATTA